VACDGALLASFADSATSHLWSHVDLQLSPSSPRRCVGDIVTPVRVEVLSTAFPLHAASSHSASA
jgi:hypothetical protein